MASTRTGAILIGSNTENMRVIYNETHRRPAVYAHYIQRHIRKFGYGPVMSVLSAHNWSEIYPEAACVEEIGRPAGTGRFFSKEQYPAQATSGLLISSARIDRMSKSQKHFRINNDSCNCFPMLIAPSPANRPFVDEESTVVKVKVAADEPTTEGEVQTPEAVEPQVVVETPAPVEPAKAETPATPETVEPVAPDAFAQPVLTEPSPFTMSLLKTVLAQSATVLITRDENGALVVETDNGTMTLAA